MSSQQLYLGIVAVCLFMVLVPMAVIVVLAVAGRVRAAVDAHRSRNPYMELVENGRARR